MDLAKRKEAHDALIEGRSVEMGGPGDGNVGE